MGVEESPDGFRRFVGFRSSALELATTAVSVCVSRVPCTGPELLGSALRCLHGLLAMFLSPAGHAPHMQPLAQHVLELVGKRERGRPSRDACRCGRCSTEHGRGMFGTCMNSMDSGLGSLELGGFPCTVGGIQGVPASRRASSRVAAPF